MSYLFNKGSLSLLISNGTHKTKYIINCARIKIFKSLSKKAQKNKEKRL